MKSMRSWIAGAKDVAPIYAVMIVILAANVLLQPNLLSPGNIQSLAVQLAPYVLTAMAQAMVMLLAGIDLAVGMVASLASAVVATSLGRGLPDIVVVFVVMAGCAVLGMATGFFVAYLSLPPLVVTLATSFIWTGLALTILPQPGGRVPEEVAVWFTGVYGGIPMIMIVMACVLLLWFIIRRLPVGLRMYAVGNSPQAARVTGVSVITAHLWGFGLGGFFAGLAGIVLSAQTGSGDPGIGASYTLSSIAAAVIGGVSLFGGKGRIAGAVAGAVVIGMIGNLLLYAGVPSFTQFIVQGAILLVIVAFTAWRRLRDARPRPIVTGASGNAG